MQVDRCLNLGEVKKYKKEAKPSITNSQVTEKKSLKTEKKNDNVDPEFAEFLEVHSKRQKDKSIWDNDGIDGSTIKITSVTVPDEEEEVNTVAHNKELSDLQVRLQLESFVYLFFYSLFLYFSFKYLKSKVVAGSEEKDGQKPSKTASKKDKEKTEER